MEVKPDGPNISDKKILRLEALFKEVIELTVPSHLLESSELDLSHTPYRIAKMYSQEILGGYRKDADDNLDKTFKMFPVDSDHTELVVIRNIPYYSMCSHHMVPFFGTAHVGYLPDEQLVGLSKIPRVVNHFSRRLQVQERLVGEIADYLYNNLQPKACIVVMSGRHLCMEQRGVRCTGAETITTAIRGAMTDGLRDEFYRNIKGT